MTMARDKGRKPDVTEENEIMQMQAELDGTAMEETSMDEVVTEEATAAEAEVVTEEATTEEFEIVVEEETAAEPEVVTEEETTEEIYQSSGISTEIADEDEILSGNIFSAIRARTPWLFITLIGEFVAVNIGNHFDNTLNALPIIAIFMPLLAGLGGNIGTQSITLMVRGLSTGQVSINSALHYMLRETFIGLAIGSFFGIMVSLVTWGWQHSAGLGIIVGLAMAINMTMATIIGTCTPFILKSMKVDPAVASGPVIATTIDVVGLAIYFTLVSTFLIHLKG